MYRSNRIFSEKSTVSVSKKWSLKINDADQSYSHAGNLSQFSRYLWSDGCVTHVTEHMDAGVGKIVNLLFRIVSRDDYPWSFLFYAQTHLSRVWYVTYDASDGIRKKDPSEIADWFGMVSHLTTSDVEGVIVNSCQVCFLGDSVCVTKQTFR